MTPQTTGQHADQSRCDTLTNSARVLAGDHSPGDQTRSVPHCRDVAGPNLPGSHEAYESHADLAAGDSSPMIVSPTTFLVAPKPVTSASTNLPGQEVHDSQRDFAGHQVSSAIVAPPPMPVAPTNQGGSAAKAESTPNPHTPETHPGPILADPVLGLFADVVDDLERVRIANDNRLRQLTDQGEHGHGLSLEHPEVRRLADLVTTLTTSEHQAVLALKRALRAHPLGPWVKATPGVGEKQAARLLAVIRDPYWNDLHSRPRTVSELWAFCGMHTVPAGRPGDQEASDTHVDGVARVAPVRRRGHRNNWNNTARQRVWLIAESCVKVTSSPYRTVYDQTRTKYADTVHEVPCARCGPAGSPAPPGSALSAGHQHARAMRAMCKAILRDLWRQAADIHHQRAEDADQGAGVSLP